MGLFRRSRKKDRAEAAGPQPATPQPETAPEEPAALAESGPSAILDEERAIREAAERAALARLGQTVEPAARTSSPDPDPGEVTGRVSEPDRSAEGEHPAEEVDRRAQAEAERRIREVEEMQGEAKPDAPHRLKLIAELRDAERQLDERGVQEEALARELVETEQRLAENQQRTAAALERAAERLEQVESRAAEAEQRAARAERLAAVKAEEIERAERLREMLDRIAKAEHRAIEAELRARAAVKRVSAPVPEIDPDAIFDRHTSEQTAGSSAIRPSTAPSEPASPPDEPPPRRPAADAPAAADAPPIDLNSATYEQLRDLGLSVTQTGRLLAHRERVGGFSSVAELNGIPGFPQGFVDDLEGRVRI